MNLTRRGFLKSCLALAAAPAIVRAENIMRIWTPPQDLALPSWEVFAPQIERAVPYPYLSTTAQNFIGSMWYKSGPHDKWKREIIEMRAMVPDVMPAMRLDRNGLRVASGGEVVSRRIVESEIGPGEVGKVVFPAHHPDAHMTLGSEQGIGLYGVGVTMPAPDHWPEGRAVRWPMVNNLEPRSEDAPFFGKRRVLRTPTEESCTPSGLLKQLLRRT